MTTPLTVEIFPLHLYSTLPRTPGTLTERGSGRTLLPLLVTATHDGGLRARWAVRVTLPDGSPVPVETMALHAADMASGDSGAAHLLLTTLADRCGPRVRWSDVTFHTC